MQLTPEPCIIHKACPPPSPPAEQPPVAVLLPMAFDLLLGIVSLHSKGIVHRDIKLNNIGCTHGRLVLFDLGSARVGSGLRSAHHHSEAAGECLFPEGICTT